MNRLELDIELKRDEFRLAVAESLDLAGITAIFGANGSGKTSLLRVIAGLERQRVAIARALLANPALLLMDEPLSSLDHPRRAELLPLIRELPTRFGIPILLVTHDIDELVYLADEVILLADGKNVGRGSAREILERSDFERLTHLREPGTVLEAEIQGQTDGLTTVSMPGGELRIPHVTGSVGDRIRLRIHPRDVILAIERPSGISIRNSLATTVRSLEAAGDEQVMVTLAVGDQQLKARITRDAADDLGLAPGQPIHALIKTVALDAFG
jgi:molybdate transport system ATP-binding protein